MKFRNSTLIAAFGLFCSVLNAQSIEVPQTKIPMFTKIAADWCPPCGGWGWNFYEGALDDNSAKAMVWTIHHSGGLTNSTASKLAHNFNIIGQPEFYLDMTKEPVNSSNYTTYFTTLSNQVNNLAAGDPLAQTGLIAAHADGELKVVTKTRFFNPTDGGEYRLGVYLVEKLYVGFQQSQGNNAQHKELFRRKLTTDDFGMLLSDQAIAAGTEFSLQTSVPWSEITYPQSNIRIVTVIWKKDGNRYLAVNTNYTDFIQDGLVSTNERIEPDLTLQIWPNPLEDQGSLWLKNPVQLQRLNIDLFDRSGRLIKNLFNGQVPAGENNLPFSVAGLPQGSYLIRATTATESIARWAVVK